MNEFTGERVIPGQVNDDLWAEHLARYALATRFAVGRNVLDAGCGTGYGTADLARVSTSAVGLDVANEAIAYARTHFPGPKFVQASATSLPFRSGSFDLVTAFEVIEHLQDCRPLLSEAQRVLTPNGLLLVSTPNKRYYAEARAKSGPNPFHEHEFEFAEFSEALKEFFPHVRILFQDRVEAFAFHGADHASTAEIARQASNAEAVHFFIGISSCSPLPALPGFVYVPKAANLLREREEHIHLLEQELAQVRTWLDETIADRDKLLRSYVDLQESATRTINDLNEENVRKTEWALDIEKRLTADLEKGAAQLSGTVRLLDRAEATVVERTEWAQRLDQQLRETKALLEAVRQSRWLKLGRRLGLGPNLKEPPE